MSQKCLVTGAAGFIGSHLIDRLLERGCFVLGVDNMKLGRRANLARALEHPKFKFVELDVNSAVLTPGDVQTHGGKDPANSALIPAPVITPLGGPTPTPEFGSVFSLGGLLLAGGSGLWYRRRRMRGTPRLPSRESSSDPLRRASPG